MPEYLQIMTAFPNKKSARRLTSGLIEKRLAACVQIIGPTESHFVWEGRQRRQREWICIIKTKAKARKPIEAQIRKTHEYEVPEIISFRICKGSKEYLAWLNAAVK